MPVKVNLSRGHNSALSEGTRGLPPPFINRKNNSVMRRFFAALLLVIAAKAEAAPITYELLPFQLSSVSGQFDVEGSITTDGTLGMLATVNILSWNWSASNGVEAYQASSAAGTIGLLDNMEATASDLRLLDAPFHQGTISLESTLETWTLQFLNVQATGLTTLLTLPDTPRAQGSTPVGTSPFIIATVPEPSSFVIAAFGLIGLVVWRRRR